MSSTLPIPKSPFASPSLVTTPGRGEVVVSILPPSTPTLTTLSYKYPLKLLSRIPTTTLDSKYPTSATTPVHLYLLTYGGGLLPGDEIDVSITLRKRVRLVVTTPQGSTKIYKADGKTGSGSSNNSRRKSRQTVNVEIGRQAGLCYLPDPCVPFEKSRYEQLQQFTVIESSSGEGEDVTKGQQSSLCVLDWVTQGRTASGENWSFHLWKGRNEVWSQHAVNGSRRLLLRDSLILSDEISRDEAEDGKKVAPPSRQQRQGHSSLLPLPLPIAARTHPHGILGTLILYGPLFDSLASFMMQEFTSQPRIGGRNWSSEFTPQTPHSHEGVLWTAARVRTEFVVVKFGARDYERAREWLGELIRREGSVEREFGPEALGCL